MTVGQGLGGIRADGRRSRAVMNREISPPAHSQNSASAVPRGAGTFTDGSRLVAE